MQHKKAVACASAVLLALAVACSKNSESPVSPSSAQPGTTEAGPNGETLKANAPTPQSPVNGAQPDELVFTAGKSSGTFNQDLAGGFSYEFQVMNAGNTLVCAAIVPGGSGSSVTWAPNCNLDLDANHTWRVRAITQNPAGQMAHGPWSSAASFRSPVGGYIRGAELYDPLYNGTTVGSRVGGTQFIANVGLRLLGQDSRVTYTLPVTLEAGEFSVMVTGMDEGSPGDKTKVISMQEGGGDITTNDYRFTAEKRGANYTVPGAITFRMINGEGDDDDFINDGCRSGFSCGFSGLTDEKWYFWKITWNSNSGSLEVREDGPRGRQIYFDSVTTNGHAYRPVPHVIHLGSPVGRAGPIDASIPGATYKNVWVSSRPRPAIPGE
jgi:hypothetical protein